ncbi:hypothetical protein [Bartonella gliris]|uniref:hypothetical protein n=1 Tax=Bartonella gliris TaxID=3004109 RepID=UPI00295EEA9B|nr:hypothetical protein [Bartonella gliris]
MALFPFSISDIEDPECIRVVLYASGRMGHAPLNALLNQVRQEIERFDTTQSKNITQLTQRVEALEQKLQTTLQDSTNAKQQQQSSHITSSNILSGKADGTFVIGSADIEVHVPESLKIESSDPRKHRHHSLFDMIF